MNPLNLNRRQLLISAAMSGAFAARPVWAQAVAGADGVIRAHGIGIFGTPALASDFTQLPYVDTDAPKGGEMSEWFMGGFDSYNPYTLRGRAAVLSNMPLESLLTGTSDEVGTAYGLLAETIEYPENRDWVIFRLRPEARFSDGTPLTAHDVLFSYETLRDKGLVSFRAVIAQQIAKAEVLDDHSIRYYFTPDYPRRDLIQSVGGLPVFSRKDFQDNKRDIAQSSNVPFIGSGPYVIEPAEMGRRVVLRRNPDCWGKDLAINRGRYNFDRLRVEYFADYDTAFEGFKAGEYRFRSEASAINWATGYDFPAAQSGQVVRETIPNGNIPNGQAWAINLRRPQFQDIRVRKALSLMFNFEWANQALFYGLYKRVNSFWENSDLAAQGVPSPEEVALLEPVAADLPEGILTDEAVTAATSGDQQLDRRNLRQAAALLDAAGWTAGQDGLRRRNGQTLRVEFLNDSQTFDRVINPYVQNLRALGVDAANVRVDDAQYEERRRNHDYDLISVHLGQSEIPGGGLQQYFGSASAGDVFNAMGLANPAIDKLIRAVEAADSQEALALHTRVLDRALRSLIFWVPQWYNPDYIVAYWDMFTHPGKMPPYALGEMDFWWQDEEKAQVLRSAGVLRQG
ncbi:MAG: extracellular solute-binding protein [Paracoccus sp. (in: a-proteobacteria)]|uniref:extracellular solute-binding protein n=1 Tax=Paracoccus sp. TaxID=267 RepID=UPI0026E0812C|nr:extracellular solute-binding protein [Paracoccus sp. (in: a-proteobacteria)]MDO5622004.1 extracellular solute-binding protein [Paracoccus sp. (in: a-proteobacteria)]